MKDLDVEEARLGRSCRVCRDLRRQCSAAALLLLTPGELPPPVLFVGEEGWILDETKTTHFRDEELTWEARRETPRRVERLDRTDEDILRTSGRRWKTLVWNKVPTAASMPGAPKTACAETVRGHS